MPAGANYSVADETGYLGDVTITSRTDVDMTATAGCPVVIHQAAASAAGSMAVTGGGLRLAIGPTERPYARARVLDRRQVKGQLVPDRQADALVIAIDLDGDADPDVAAYNYPCRPRNPPPGGFGTVCVETWTREREKWRMTASAEVPDC